MDHAEFSFQLSALQDHVARLTEEQALSPGELAADLELIEALRVALEELRVADEELRAQNEQLAQSREDLELQRQRYRDLFEHAPDAYVVTTQQGAIREVNWAAAALLGIRPEVARGKPLVVFVAGESRRLFRSQLALLTNSWERQEWELVLQPRGVAPVPARVAIAKFVHGHAAAPELLWLLRDLTEQRRAEALGRERDELEQRVHERTAQLEVANAELQESRSHLQALARVQVTLQENERRIIARELHDEASQFLAAFMLGLGRLEKIATNDSQALAVLNDLKELTDRVMQNLHSLATDLRPASLERLGLVPAVRQSVEELGRRSDVQATFEAVGLEGVRLPETMEIALYRIVQEALNNAVRHGHARSVAVTLLRQADRVVAIVEDDGVGFEADEAVASSRLGLLGMRERAAALGGTLTIESTEGAGATVYASLPLVPEAPPRTIPRTVPGSAGPD